MANKTTQTAAKYVRFKAQVYWAEMVKPNEMSGKFEFKACNLNPKTIEALEALNLEVKVSEKNPEMGQFLVFRSSRPFIVQDEDGDKMDASVIGNGTEVIITAGSYDWTFKGKKGTSANARKIIVTQLVEYTGGEVNEDEVTDVL